MTGIDRIHWNSLSSLVCCQTFVTQNLIEVRPPTESPVKGISDTETSQRPQVRMMAGAGFGNSFNI